MDKFSSQYTSTTKTKKEIIDSLAGKNPNLNSNLDEKTIEDFGYSNPLTSSSEFTIKYKLKELPTDDSPKLKIEVTLQNRGDESKPKEIIIKPLVIDFATQKEKFITQISDKTISEIDSTLSGKKDKEELTPEILKQIGFKVPQGFDTTFKTTYFLVENWIDVSTEVTIELILEKRGEKATPKRFIILEKGGVSFTATETFKDEVQKWQSKTSQTSDKTISEIDSTLSGKKDKEELTPEILSEIGFEFPLSLDTTSFTYHYTLEEDWTDDSKKVKIGVKLKKDRKKYHVGFIEINPKTIDFNTGLDKFVHKKSSKTKGEILQTIENKLLGDITIVDVGYTPPNFESSFIPTYTITKIPSDTDPKITIKVTLTKQLMTDTKTIIITPETIDFSDKLSKFVDKYTTKTNDELKIALQSKSQNDELTTVDLQNIGYSPPALTPFFPATYTLDETWVDGTSTEIKIKVIIKHRGDKSLDKVIKITPLETALDTQLAEFQNKVVSLKTKGEITVALKDKDKKDEPLDVDTLATIGYNPPKISGFNVTYKLKENWTSASTEVKIEVTLKKGLMTAAKEITITPTTIDFSAELAKFVDTTSSRTKGEITNAVENKLLKDITIVDIGYTSPTSHKSSEFNAKYTITKVPSNTDPKFTIQVTLTQRLMTATKEITITPLLIDFNTELAKFDDQTSSKTKGEITNAVENKLLKDITIVDIGYTSPTSHKSSEFNAKYTITKVPSNTDPKFTIQVTLTQRLMTATKEITITPLLIDFNTELAKFDHQTSSKTKGEITQALENKNKNDLDVITLKNIGYNYPTLDPAFTTKHKITKDPSDTDPKFTIQVTLTQRLMTATKEITITPLLIDFNTELAKFDDQTSSKTKGEITQALENKNKNDLDVITLKNIGYNYPTLDPAFTTKHKITKDPSDTDPKFTIQVTLTQRLMTATKTITITPLFIDFNLELDKFKENEYSLIKTYELIKTALNGKKKNDELTKNDLDNIGYNKPTNLDNSFVKKYSLAKNLVDNTSTEFKIQITLEKKSEKSVSKTITIKLIHELLAKELEKFTDHLQSDKENIEEVLRKLKGNENNFIPLTKNELGIAMKDFSNGIYATYKFQKSYDDFNAAELRIQLVKDIEKNGKIEKVASKKDFNLYPKYDYYKYLFQKEEFQSSKNEQQLRDYYEEQNIKGFTVGITVQKFEELLKKYKFPKMPEGATLYIELASSQLSEVPHPFIIYIKDGEDNILMGEIYKSLKPSIAKEA